MARGAEELRPRDWALAALLGFAMTGIPAGVFEWIVEVVL